MVELDKDTLIQKLLLKVGELTIENQILLETGVFPFQADRIEVPLNENGPTEEAKVATPVADNGGAESEVTSPTLSE